MKSTDTGTVRCEDDAVFIYLFSYSFIYLLNLLFIIIIIIFFNCLVSFSVLVFLLLFSYVFLLYSVCNFIINK